MDRRLSVRKSSSSSRITKSTSAPKRLGLPSSYPPHPPPSASSSRPPPTIVKADLNSFRLVVQQLTGTPPPSSSPSPVRNSPKNSRLQRIAPPPLRSRRKDQQALWQQQLEAAPYHHHQEHHYSALRPPSPTPHPILSPHLLSPLPPLTSRDNTWANPLDASTSPRLVLLSPLPPLFPNRAENLAGYGEREFMDPSGSASLNFHCSGSFTFSPTSKRNPLLSPLSNLHSSTSHSWQRPPPLSPYAHALPPLPSPPLMPPLSPYPASYSPTTSFAWLPPWPPSPFLSPPSITLSPGLFPPSPVLGLFPFASSPKGFSFNQSANDHSA